MSTNNIKLRYMKVPKYSKTTSYGFSVLQFQAIKSIGKKDRLLIEQYFPKNTEIKEKDEKREVFKAFPVTDKTDTMPAKCRSAVQVRVLSGSSYHQAS